MGRPALHFHLSHLHNVVPECVEKLLLVVSGGWSMGSGQGSCAGGEIGSGLPQQREAPNSRSLQLEGHSKLSLSSHLHSRVTKTTHFFRLPKP